MTVYVIAGAHVDAVRYQRVHLAELDHREVRLISTATPLGCSTLRSRRYDPAADDVRWIPGWSAGPYSAAVVETLAVIGWTGEPA